MAPRRTSGEDLANRAVLSARVVRAWKAVEFPVLALLAIVAFALGYTGFRDTFGVSGSVYRSLQLFGLGGEVVPDEPLRLDIARYLAPFVAGYAAVRALLALLHQQFSFLTARLARQHVVVVGLSDKGFQLARALRAADLRVVVIEVDPTHPSIPGCRDRGIPVIAGDATDLVVLRRARVHRARSVIVVAGSDAVNVEVASALSTTAEARTGQPLTAFVSLDDVPLWRALAFQRLRARSRQLRLELFNLGELAAHVLVSEHPPLPDPRADGAPSAGIALAGSDGVAAALVASAARQWRTLHPAPEQLQVTVIGPSAEADCRRLLEHTPRLETVCRLNPVNLDPLDPKAAAAARRELKGHHRLYVCLADESRGLATALALGESDRHGCPTVLVVRDEHAGPAAMADAAGEPGLETFGMLTRALTPELLVRGTIEVLARANHEHYLAGAGGPDPARDESLATWEALPESLRESNRRFAEGIGPLLDKAGCIAIPQPLADPVDPGFAFPSTEVDRLAELEHERWMSDLLADGWRYGETKDPHAKLHPKLVPWEELTEDDRDTDRAAVRSIPSVLARAGFEIATSDGAAR